MLYIICLMVGGAIGVLTAALFGAGKINHLRRQNEYLWQMYQKYYARCLLKIMEEGEVPPVPSVGKEP